MEDKLDVALSTMDSKLMNESLLAAATLPFRLKKAEVAMQVVSSSQADASKLQLEAQQVLCFVALPIERQGGPLACFCRAGVLVL